MTTTGAPGEVPAAPVGEVDPVEPTRPDDGAVDPVEPNHPDDGAGAADGAGGAGAADGAGAAGGDVEQPPDAVGRLDLVLVARGLARSRTQAAKLLSGGRVLVNGAAVGRASRPVAAADVVTLAPVDGDPAAAETDWVSRGAVKLDQALTALARVPVRAARCLDAGASTGGFTEVLLRRGAAHVVAVDVGRDQLDAGLAADPRVDSREGVSVRGLAPAEVGGPVDLLVADLSFISLVTVLPDLSALVHGSGHLVLMVKPQFEVGRARLPRGGVVRDVGDRVWAVLAVAAAGRALNWTVAGAVASALPGPAGNREFFVWFTRAPDGPAGDRPQDVGDETLAQIVQEAG